jgi:PPK2 family polyphosphate:nucleotide phosphotransferase
MPQRGIGAWSYTPPMPTPAESPYRVPFDGSFRIAEAPTTVAGAPGKKEQKERLGELADELDELQRRLYASGRWAVLLIFQALDAAGKDGTIRAVLRKVDPAGCRVHSFKEPSPEELDHDFLWRTTLRLPPRGTLGVFNRSYYEEVLAVRVHPEFLAAQGLPHRPPLDALWEERFQSIRDHERHLARNGTLILKFWLNVSPEEQRQRFLSRLEEPEKHWKFAVKDVAERDHFAAYLAAYEEALAATSRPWAPWYALPADDKPTLRVLVADILVESLRALDLCYPEVSAADAARFEEMRARLEDGP